TSSVTARLMSFSLDREPMFPGSFPPCPASKTIFFIRKAGIIVSFVINPPNRKGIAIRKLKRIFLLLNRSMRAIELTLRKISSKLNKAQAAVSGFRILFFIISGLWIFPQLASAQQPAQPKRERVLNAPDTLILPPRTPPTDTLPARRDTLINVDSAKIMPTSTIQTDILYFAEDSIVTDFVDNKVYLYNKAWFEY